MDIKIEKPMKDFSFTHWYYYKGGNEDKISYEIYSFWSENGGLNKLFEKLKIVDVDVNLGECFTFNLDYETLGLERDLKKDFSCVSFKIIEITHDFIQDGDNINTYKTYELEPYYNDI